MEHFKVVYDFSTELHLDDFLICLVPLGFLFIVQILVPMGIRNFAPTDEAYRKVMATKLTKAIFVSHRLLLWLLFLIITTSTIYSYVRTWNVYHSSSLLTVQGRVDNFLPVPEGTRGTESFAVNGVYFKSTDQSNFGYNTTPWRASIHKGLLVRIRYYEDDGNNVILKLETERMD